MVSGPRGQGGRSPRPNAMDDYYGFGRGLDIRNKGDAAISRAYSHPSNRQPLLNKAPMERPLYDWPGQPSRGRWAAQQIQQPNPKMRDKLEHPNPRMRGRHPSQYLKQIIGNMQGSKRSDMENYFSENAGDTSMYELGDIWGPSFPGSVGSQKGKSYGFKEGIMGLEETQQGPPGLEEGIMGAMPGEYETAGIYQQWKTIASKFGEAYANNWLALQQGT